MGPSRFLARIKFYADGVAKKINGPRRRDERRAERDLELITAAAVDVPDRAERFDAMATEAQRLQVHAGYETEIAIALGQKQFDTMHIEKVIETDDGGNGDDQR